MRFTIKQARLHAGLTQREMAQMLNVHRDTYRRIESEPETATIAQACLISEITGIAFDDIFFAGNSTESRKTVSER